MYRKDVKKAVGLMNKKEIYGVLLSWISAIAGIDNAKIFDTLFRDHKKLNLKNPQSLSEKVSWIELHDQSPLAVDCTDKYMVRKYIVDKGLSDILIPIYGEAYTSFEEIDLNSLPNSFAIKATHGCKMNYFVPDKNKFDSEKCKKVIQRWMTTTYGLYSMEPHYMRIPHRFYIEKYLEKADQLIDYKFHCLNGEPRFILTCSDRKNDGDKKMKVILNLFDMGWNPIHEIVTSGLEKPGEGLPKPEHFDKMVQIAKILSKDFKFVRVDLYELDGKVYFGELTFTPAHCVFPYFSKAFDLEMGRLLKL